MNLISSPSINRECLFSLLDWTSKRTWSDKMSLSLRVKCRSTRIVSEIRHRCETQQSLCIVSLVVKHLVDTSIFRILSRPRLWMSLNTNSRCRVLVRTIENLPFLQNMCMEPQVRWFLSPTSDVITSDSDIFQCKVLTQKTETEKTTLPIIYTPLRGRGRRRLRNDIIRDVKDQTLFRCALHNQSFQDKPMIQDLELNLVKVGQQQWWVSSRQEYLWDLNFEIFLNTLSMNPKTSPGLITWNVCWKCRPLCIVVIYCRLLTPKRLFYLGIGSID